MTKYITCADTAKLIRKSLKEAFPDVTFSVRSKTYSGGASISIGWTDGPNQKLVEAVARHFKAAYVDGGIDYKGSVYHMMDGEQVHLGADFIHFNRGYTSASIQRAIDRVYRKYGGNFRDSTEPKATVEDYSRGRLYNAQVPGLSAAMGHSVQTEIGEALYMNSDRLKINKSPTAGKVFVTHDDGYSANNGSGFSAVPSDL